MPLYLPQLSRREFLKRAALAGAAVAGHGKLVVVQAAGEAFQASGCLFLMLEFLDVSYCVDL